MMEFPKRPMDAQISVVSSPGGDGWTCTVQITEANGQTRHSVTLRRSDFQQLTAGKETTPETLVKKSFEFLLEREPKHHILRQFDLPAIGKYFPDFHAEILKRL